MTLINVPVENQDFERVGLIVENIVAIEPTKPTACRIRTLTHEIYYVAVSLEDLNKALEGLKLPKSVYASDSSAVSAFKFRAGQAVKVVNPDYLIGIPDEETKDLYAGVYARVINYNKSDTGARIYLVESTQSYTKFHIAEKGLESYE